MAQTHSVAGDDAKRRKYYAENLAFLQSVKKSTLLGGNILFKLLLLPISLLLAIANLFHGKGVKAKEFDARVAAKMAEAKKRVFAVLGVDKSQVQEVRPIITESYVKDEDTYINRDPKTGAVRSSKYCSSIYLFSRDEIYVYNYEFSMIDDWTVEETYEYFYRDVVTVNVFQGRTSVLLGEAEGKGLFKKSKTSAVTVPIVLNYFSLVTTGGISCKSYFTETSTIESINAMKQLIREKKTD